MWLQLCQRNRINVLASCLYKIHCSPNSGEKYLSYGGKKKKKKKKKTRKKKKKKTILKKKKKMQANVTHEKHFQTTGAYAYIGLFH